jgi:ATP-dependent RNA helicase RhlE
MLFDRLGLRAELLKGIKKKGYNVPTPIQTKAIPAILDGRDVLARAQTGTGKTDAFALPLVEILSRKKGQGKYPRALVLTPTRELALQVGDSIKAYARRVDLRCTVVYGGVRIESQISRLKRGIDILVATPGRLLDLAGQRHLELSRIEFLVFDEADRMLDLGFSEEISAVLDLVPADRRTMLFSATYTRQIRDLAGRMLQDPQHIEVTPKNTAAESVVQKVYLVDRADKRALLTYLITRGKWSRILVFTRTKHGANKLTDKLTEQGIHSAAMHGNMSQSSRSRTLEDFKNGKIRVLVATDVAARGLDISNLPYVVNYDMPSVPEDYVHRIGRTGRAGVNGVAISLVSQDEKRHLQAVEKLLNQKIPVETVDGYTEDSVVPDYVLYRPNNSYSELTADKEIKEIVARRAASKQRSKGRKAKSSGSGKRAGPKSTARKAKGPGSVKSSKMNSRGRKTKPVGSVKKRNAVKPQK